MKTVTRVLTVCGALLVAACAEEASVAGPEFDIAGPSFAHVPTGATCEVVTFDGFEHGDDITSLPNLFGGAFSLTVATTNNDPDPAAENVAKAYDTDQSGNGDPDLEVSGDCAACGPLDIVAVIPDVPFSGTGAEGDTPSGGIIELTGFPTASAADGDGQAWIESYDGVDQEASETAIELFIDGVLRGATTGLGNGSVENIHADAHSAIDEDVEFHFGGSGAIDNIKVCFLDAPPPPCDGLTPGYWRNWSNHYTQSEFQELVDWVNDNDYNLGADLEISEITSILSYGGPDAVMKLKKFYYANLLTLALTDLDHLPNPDTASLEDDCVSSGFPGTTLAEALDDAEDILENDGAGYRRNEINAVKDVLDAIANLND